MTLYIIFIVHSKTSGPSKSVVSSDGFKWICRGTVDFSSPLQDSCCYLVNAGAVNQGGIQIFCRLCNRQIIPHLLEEKITALLEGKF